MTRVSDLKPLYQKLSNVQTTRNRLLPDNSMLSFSEESQSEVNYNFRRPSSPLTPRPTQLGSPQSSVGHEQQGLSSNPSELSESSGQNYFQSRSRFHDDCQLVFPSQRHFLQKVEEEKSSDVFATEQENSSDFLSFIDTESEQELTCTDRAKRACWNGWSRTTDTLLWLCEGLYYILINILLVPVAMLGLLFDKLRHLLRKVSRRGLIFSVSFEVKNPAASAR